MKDQGRAILLVGPKAPPFGGIQRFAEQVLKLQNKDYQYDFLADNIPAHWRPNTRKSKFTWNIVKRDGFINTIKALSFVGGKYLEFVIKLITGKPCCVHILSSNNLAFYRNSVYVILAKMLGKRCILHHLGQVDDMLNYASPRHKAIMTKLLKLPNIHVTQSEGLSEFLRQYTDRPVETIYNPINTFIIDNDFRTKHDYSTSSRHFLAVGYLGHSKGTYDIVDAVTDIKTEMMQTQSKVRFIGGGDVVHFRQLAEERGCSDLLEFCGELSDQDKADMLQQWADVFLLPSHAEGQPIAVLEAMATSLPVIVGRVGSLPELIAHNMGYLISPGDHTELKRVMLDCIDSGEKLLEYGKNCREWTLTYHDWETFASKTTALYD